MGQRGDPEDFSKLISNYLSDTSFKQNFYGLNDKINLNSLKKKLLNFFNRCFVEEKLGAKYTEARSADFAEIFKKMDSTTPIFFILSAGVDPTRVDTLIIHQIVPCM